MRLRGLRALVLSFNTGLALCEQLGELVQLTSLEARDVSEVLASLGLCSHTLAS